MKKRDLMDTLGIIFKNATRFKNRQQSSLFSPKANLQVLRRKTMLKSLQSLKTWDNLNGKNLYKRKYLNKTITN